MNLSKSRYAKGVQCPKMLWMDALHFPLYFLDFEAFQPAIPPFDGVSPYQQTG